MMRVQLPTRAVISRASVSLTLAILILSTTSPAIAEEDQKQAATDFEPPQLLYLTWQEERPRDPEGKHYPVWKPDGELLDNKATAALRKQLAGFALFNQREDQHHPLILIFKIDKRATKSPVMPTLMNASGTPLVMGGSMNNPRAGMIVTSIAPSQKQLLLWPEQGTIEVRYPVENPTTVKTLEGPPAGRIEVAKGVTWELDPNYARERDPKTGRSVAAKNKLAGVLITNPNEADPLVDFEVTIELRGGKLLRTRMHTAKSNPVGKPSRLDISEAVENSQQITKLFIVRQRHAIKRFKDLPLKRDLLFKALQKDESDE